MARPTGSANNLSALFSVGFGTTYAGRTDDTGLSHRSESKSAGFNSDQYGPALHRRTLIVNENIYFSGAISATGTATYRGFTCIVLKLDDLDADAWFYATQTHSGNAPTSYDTSGAGATVPATGDWWIVAQATWLIDSTSADLFLAIHNGSGDVSEYQSEGENTSDFRVVGTMTYQAGLAASTTVRARYRTDSSSHDASDTRIFGLRLDAFENYWGQQSANTITHTVTDTDQEFAGNNSFVLDSTGPLLAIGWPIHVCSDTTQVPYGRILLDGSEIPAADSNRANVSEHGSSGQHWAPWLCSYVASQAADTYDLSMVCAEDQDVSPNKVCDGQVGVAFSLTLAVAAVTATAAAAMQRFAAQATGWLIPEGVAAAAMQRVAAQATGALQPEGTAAAAIQRLMAQGTGAFTDTAVSGAAAAAMQNLATAASGELTISGAATAEIQKFLAAATGAIENEGDAVAVMQVLAAVATGLFGDGGVAAGQMQRLLADADGTVEVQGSASPALQRFAASATGLLVGAVLAQSQQGGFLKNPGRMMTRG